VRHPKLLLVRSKVIMGEFSGYLGIAYYLNLGYENNHVTYKGRPMNPQYSDEWTPEKAMLDWCKDYLSKQTDYKIYGCIFTK
jgi:hypothetical protein